MDERRFDTGQLLDMGILNLPLPQTRRKNSAGLIEVDQDEYTEESLRGGLEAVGLCASQYYGCWRIWKTDTGYSGELLQYRVVTEEFTDKDIEFALEKAEEWVAGCYG